MQPTKEACLRGKLGVGVGVVYFQFHKAVAGIAGLVSDG